MWFIVVSEDDNYTIMQTKDISALDEKSRWKEITVYHT
jgi:hypothetical protein